MSHITFTIKARLASAMVILSVLLLAIGVIGLVGISTVVDTNRELFQERLPKTVAADNMLLWMGRQRTSLDQASVTTDTAWAERMYQTADDVRKQAFDSWAKYQALPQTEHGKQLAQDVTTGLTQTEQAMDEFRTAIKGGDRQAVSDAARKVGTIYTALQKSESILNDYETEQARLSYEASEHRYQNFRLTSALVIVFGLIVAAYGWFSLRRAISDPINRALKHFDDIAAGDLTHTVQIRSADEMGQLLAGLSKMQDNLVKTVSTVRSGSDAIASATKQIAAGNLDLSGRTEQQAASLEETAASMEQLTSTVKHNADNARQATTLAGTASDIAGQGNEVVGRVVDTMDEIKESSAKITEIVGIIDSIAFQTNILALNAAVEAARAGEQGRGFAVVASEVRTLAQRSSSAAKEIKTLIMHSVDRVQSGSVLVHQAGQTMSEIIGAVKRVTDIMGEISSASSEQSSGIDQVSRAVTQMDEATQQNAALVEQASAAAQSLEQQALSLKDAVSVFRITGEASYAAAPTPLRSAPAVSPRKAAHAATARADAPRRATPAPARKTAAASHAGSSAAKPLPQPAPAAKASGGADEWETF
jgi:methyl-accepting chemotaxis protein-1 (serine sensor receptor)